MLTDRDAAALRLGVPVALSLGFAVVLGVPLGFLGAVFAGVFLQFPAALPVRAGVFLVVETALMMCGAWALFAVLQPYPVVFLAAIMGAVFWGFWRAVIQKASPLSVIVALMAALLTPFLVLTSPALAWSVALWIPVHIGIGIVLSYAGFSMWPPRPRATHEGASAGEAPHTSDRETRDEQARMLARMSMVAMPMVIAFYVFDAGAVLTLIFDAVLAQQLASASAASPPSRQNHVGGQCAWRHYSNLCLRNSGHGANTSLAVCSAFAGLHGASCVGVVNIRACKTRRIGVDRLCHPAGGAIAPFGDEAAVKTYVRLIQVDAATLYIVGAYLVVDYLVPLRPKSHQPA